MLRAILGVIAGYAAWTILWLTGNALLFAAPSQSVNDGARFESAGTLAGLLLYAAAISLVGGGICALVAGPRTRGASLCLAVALLATGIAVQAGIWPLLPAWYHVIFLALLVPLTLLGGCLTRRAPTPQPA